jgi:transcriptional regulator with XRE-family HTH domain
MIAKNFEPFPCVMCGADVHLVGGKGRTRLIARDVEWPIPNDFKLPTCSECGEIYFSIEYTDTLDALLDSEYAAHQAAHVGRLVSILRSRHGVTSRDVEKVCSVTPSYLSHVIAGRKKASVKLQRLLEAYVADSSEFTRHLEGRPWCEAEVSRLVMGGHYASKEWANSDLTQVRNSCEGLAA